MTSRYFDLPERRHFSIPSVTIHSNYSTVWLADHWRSRDLSRGGKQKWSHADGSVTVIPFMADEHRTGQCTLLKSNNRLEEKKNADWLSSSFSVDTVLFLKSALFIFFTFPTFLFSLVFFRLTNLEKWLDESGGWGFVQECLGLCSLLRVVAEAGEVEICGVPWNTKRQTQISRSNGLTVN